MLTTIMDTLVCLEINISIIRAFTSMNKLFFSANKYFLVKTKKKRKTA